MTQQIDMMSMILGENQKDTLTRLRDRINTVLLRYDMKEHSLHEVCASVDLKKFLGELEPITALKHEVAFMRTWRDDAFFTFSMPIKEGIGTLVSFQHELVDSVVKPGRKKDIISGVYFILWAMKGTLENLIGHQ